MTRRELTTLQEQLAGLDDELHNLLQGHRFYEQAMVALVNDNTEPESWLIGAMVTQQLLQQSGEQLLN
jgi:hypothetical protein